MERDNEGHIPASHRPPFLIGAAGGTASGKTTVCEMIVSQLANKRVAHLSLDSFYRPPTPEELKNVANYNFGIHHGNF